MAHLTENSILRVQRMTAVNLTVGLQNTERRTTADRSIAV